MDSKIVLIFVLDFASYEIKPLINEKYSIYRLKLKLKRS